MRLNETTQRFALVAVFGASGAGVAQAHDGHNEPLGVWHNLAHAAGGPDHLQALLILGAFVVSGVIAGLIACRILRLKDRPR